MCEYRQGTCKWNVEENQAELRKGILCLQAAGEPKNLEAEFI